MNRGFVNGPLCTIYGAGAVTIYLILRPLRENLALLYLGGVVVATALEYITGWIMETVFHTRWWTTVIKSLISMGTYPLPPHYCGEFFRFCFFKLLQPFVFWITSLYPQSVGEVILTVIMILYGVTL